MSITHQQVQKLLTGNFTFSHLGFSMMITRLKGIYKNDQTSLQNCAKEINTFFDKYPTIMKSEYATISKL